MDLLQIQIEGVKSKLLTCTLDEFPRLQGEGQAYEKLVKLITRPSLAINPTEE
jgi:hypothetical protein